MYARFNTFPLHLGPAAKYIELQTIFTLFLHLPSIRLLQCSIPHIFHPFTIIVIIMIAITMIMRTRPILQLPNSDLLLLLLSRSSSWLLHHFHQSLPPQFNTNIRTLQICHRVAPNSVKSLIFIQIIIEFSFNTNPFLHSSVIRYINLIYLALHKVLNKSPYCSS